MCYQSFCTSKIKNSHSINFEVFPCSKPWCMQLARWILVTCPKVFLSLTLDQHVTPLAPNSDPICLGLLAAVTHVMLILTCQVSATTSSLTLHLPGLLRTSEHNMHHSPFCFKVLMSLGLPRTSLSKVVGVLSLYLILFCSPWLCPYFFKTHSRYHSTVTSVVCILVLISMSS